MYFRRTTYDGVFDFGGTSGRTFKGLTSSLTATATTPPPTTDLALFTRSRNITLPLTAVGQSQAYGSGESSH